MLTVGLGAIMQDGREASKPRGGAAKRPGAKPPSGAKRPSAQTLRLQLHLGEKTVERLGVHCSLVHRNQSAVADEILTSWLAHYGRGRELFADADGVKSPDEVIGGDPSA
ncbi:MAG: hypothetical protein JO034_07565 [Singulisphaera sp.]|jgi:hypothetical protein|nr:hypothetical protein [Singulisphaera sp.]